MKTANAAGSLGGKAMTSFIARYGVALAVSLFVIWSSWARGGSSPSYWWALPWISLLSVETLFVLPPRRDYESPRGAVRHLLGKLIRDPVLYFGLALLTFLTIQWLNGPRVLEWSQADAQWQFTDAPIPSLPSCVDQEGARNVLIWFSAMFAAVMSVRLGTTIRSKYLLLRILVANGALLAILGIAQMATAPTKLFWFRPMSTFFFSTFGYPNHAGSFFLLMSALNMGLLIRALASLDDNNHPIFFTVTLIFNILGVYLSVCRAAIVLETGLIVFALVYGCTYLFRRIGGVGITKIITAAVGIFLCLGIIAFSSNTQMAKEVKSITGEAMGSVYGGDREMLADAAVKIWQDNPWPGVGGWGFKEHVGLYIPEKDWHILEQRGKANVHNDILQFLCEHGAIGFGLMAAIVIAILVQLIWNLIHMERLLNDQTGRNSSWVGSIPPTVVMSLAGLTCVVIHCTIDLPFRSTAILLSWFIILACLPGIVHRRS